MRPALRAVLTAAAASRRASPACLVHTWRVNRVDVVQVPVKVGQALLDTGQMGVVAEVAAVVVPHQHPVEAAEDPEGGDGGLRAVAGRAVPDQIRPAAGVCAQGAHRVHVRVAAALLPGGFGGQRGRGLVGAQHVRRFQRVLEGLLEPGGPVFGASLRRTEFELATRAEAA